MQMKAKYSHSFHPQLAIPRRLFANPIASQHSTSNVSLSSSVAMEMWAFMYKNYSPYWNIQNKTSILTPLRLPSFR